MNESTKTLLIVGGLAIAGFIAYKMILGRGTHGSVIGHPTPGSGSTPTAPGNSGWWNNLGQWGSALTGGINTVEHTYGSISSIFGGGSGGASSSDVNTGGFDSIAGGIPG